MILYIFNVKDRKMKTPISSKKTEVENKALMITKMQEARSKDSN